MVERGKRADEHDAGFTCDLVLDRLSLELWGQIFEHRGIMLEPRYDAVFPTERPHHHRDAAAPLANAAGATDVTLVTSDVLELKVGVVLGVAHTVRACGPPGGTRRVRVVADDGDAGSRHRATLDWARGTLPSPRRAAERDSRRAALGTLPSATLDWTVPRHAAEDGFLVKTGSSSISSWRRPLSIVVTPTPLLSSRAPRVVILFDGRTGARVRPWRRDAPLGAHARPRPAQPARRGRAAAAARRRARRAVRVRQHDAQVGARRGQARRDAHDAARLRRRRGAAQPARAHVLFFTRLAGG